MALDTPDALATLARYFSSSVRVAGVSFQLSILKILAGQPDGRASLDVVKQHLALFYTSGSEWTARMKRLAERAPDLDIFGQKLIARDPGEWRITDAGRALLLAVEWPPATVSEELTLDELIEHRPASEFPPPPPPPPPRRLEDHKRRRGIRRWIARTRRSA
jgi:hypothetical protein